MDRGRGGKGSGSHDGRSYLCPRPPLCHPMGRIPGGRGEALAAIFSRPPAARTGTERHRARPARVVAGIDQRLGSCPRSRGAGGRGGDVVGAGLGRVSRVRTGTWRCPSAGYCRVEATSGRVSR